MKKKIAAIMGAAALLASIAQTATANSTQSNLRSQKAAAAAVTTTQANAMQAQAVTLGGANSALSNPYIEQKVTTPESTGQNATRIPAGGF
jgi:hypothetical protein